MSNTTFFDSESGCEEFFNWKPSYYIHDCYNEQRLSCDGYCDLNNNYSYEDIIDEIDRVSDLWD